MQEDKTTCPYCNQKMKKWKTPPLSTWSAEYFYVCFNDECSYYVKGWKHMHRTDRGRLLVPAQIRSRFRHVRPAPRMVPGRR